MRFRPFWKSCWNGGCRVLYLSLAGKPFPHPAVVATGWCFTVVSMVQLMALRSSGGVLGDSVGGNVDLLRILKPDWKHVRWVLPITPPLDRVTMELTPSPCLPWLDMAATLLSLTPVSNLPT